MRICLPDAWSTTFPPTPTGIIDHYKGFIVINLLCLRSWVNDIRDGSGEKSSTVRGDFNSIKNRLLGEGLGVRFKVGLRSRCLSPPLQNISSTTSLSSSVGANDQL